MTEGRIGMWSYERSEVDAIADGGGGGGGCRRACFQTVRLGNMLAYRFERRIGRAELNTTNHEFSTPKMMRNETNLLSK